MKKWLKITTFLLLISALLISLSFIVFPNEEIDHPKCTRILANNEKEIYETINEYEGKYTKLSDISYEFKNVLINIEDKRFYTHKGFDYKRILKSAANDIISNSFDEGASTITQQLARMIFLNNEKSLKRKLNEAYYAKKIELKYSKSKILELYVNLVYFAHNCYGIYSASKYYFNKEPGELTYADSCLLVGIINAPNVYSPFINYDKSISKRNSIAFTLYKNNKIDVTQYYKILETKPDFNLQKVKQNHTYTYYYQGISSQLKKANISNRQRGICIKSNCDIDIQNILNSAIDYYESKDEVCGIILKPYSSQILALRGGKNYASSEFNRALYAKRQIGSTFKPFLYYLGLKKGMSPLSKFTSEPTVFTLEDGSKYAPQNSSEIYAFRKINMVEAIAMSDNIYAVKTALLVGSKSIKNLLKSFGITTNVNLTTALGSVEMTPLQLASLYHTLASEGVYYPLSFINRIDNFKNQKIYSFSTKSSRIMSKEEVIVLNYMLQSPFDSSLSTYSSPTMRKYQVKMPFCVKTGTTSSSSWTVGFNKDYVVLIYVGDDDNLSLSDGALSKKIFTKIVNELPEKKDFYQVPYSYKLIKFYNSIINGYSKNYIISK